MSTDKMTQIKTKMQVGDVQGAAAELKALLAAEPDNAEAQMLYGTCCHILGDDKTFGEIHDALVPKIEKETDEKTLSLWTKYDAMWEYVVVGLLVVIAVSIAACWFYRGQRMIVDEACRSLYAGPPLSRNEATSFREGTQEKKETARQPKMLTGADIPVGENPDVE